MSFCQCPLVFCSGNFVSISIVSPPAVGVNSLICAIYRSTHVSTTLNSFWQEQNTRDNERVGSNYPSLSIRERGLLTSHRSNIGHIMYKGCTWSIASARRPNRLALLLRRNWNCYNPRRVQFQRWKFAKSNEGDQEYWCLIVSRDEIES